MIARNGECENRRRGATANGRERLRTTVALAYAMCHFNLRDDRAAAFWRRSRRKLQQRTLDQADRELVAVGRWFLAAGHWHIAGNAGALRMFYGLLKLHARHSMSFVPVTPKRESVDSC